MIFFILWRKKELSDFIEVLQDIMKKAVKKHEKEYHKT